MVLVTQANSKSKSYIEIASFLDPEAIQFLDVKNRDEAIAQLVNCLCSSYQVEELKQSFHLAVLEREKIASTGIGMGIALPHAKLAAFDDFFISIGILKKGINWNSMDHQNVQIIVLIAGPDDKQSDYLNILSQLTFILRDDEVRKRLLACTQADQIIEIFQMTQGEL